MVSVSDILKLLDQVPVWKALRGLPERMDGLERQVADLQAKVAAMNANPAIHPGAICPKCGHSEMRLTESKPHPHLGKLGVNMEKWACQNCGHSEGRTSK